MKRLRFIALAILVLLFATVVPLHSQSGNPSGAIRVNIPFQFSAGSEKFAAGDYLVSPLFERSIKIEKIGGREAAVVMTIGTGGGNNPEGPKLVFNKYGSRLFLSEVWLHHADTGRQLFVSAEEVELARAVPQERTILMVRK